MPQIIVKGLKVRYKNKKRGEVAALDGVNVAFERDCINVIVGYSGCGKTTLLRCIAGLKDYDGEIFFDGVDADALSVADRDLAYVSQSYTLYPNMTIFDNIAFPLKLAHTPRQEIVARVKELAEELGIAHCLTRKPKQLSGGQQQRAALARALIKRPAICLFDEPLSNLDVPQRAEARKLIRDCMKKYGCTAVYVTHDFSEAMALADTLTVMNAGKVEITGAPKEVFGSGNPVAESLKGEGGEW